MDPDNTEAIVTKYKKRSFKWLIGSLFCGACLLSITFSVAYSWSYFVDLSNLTQFNGILSAYAISSVLLSIFSFIFVPIEFYKQVFGPVKPVKVTDKPPKRKPKTWMFSNYIFGLLVLFAVPLIVGLIIVTVRWTQCVQDPTAHSFCFSGDLPERVLLRYYRSETINGFFSFGVFLFYMLCWGFLRTNLARLWYVRTHVQ